MNAPLDVAIDHLHCYRTAKPFFPLIQDGGYPISNWADAVVVCLKARARDDLDWSCAIETAQQIFSAGKWVLWELDFGFGEGDIDLSDQTTFYSCAVAIEEFLNRVWKEFSPGTFGLIVYRGNGDFSKRISNVGERFLEGKGVEDFPFQQELYAAELFAQYLHRLVSFLPEGLAPIAMINVSDSSSLAQAALIYSRRRFEHVHLAVSGTPLPIPGLCWRVGGSFAGWIGSVNPMTELASAPNRAVCIPQDRNCDALFLDKLENLLQYLLRSGKPFRLVCEERLSEEWDVLDQLILFPDQTSVQGERMLQGFIAAGGVMIDANTLSKS